VLEEEVLKYPDQKMTVFGPSTLIEIDWLTAHPWSPYSFHSMVSAFVGQVLAQMASSWKVVGHHSLMEKFEIYCLPTEVPDH
jgi:hypothetical protein